MSVKQIRGALEAAQALAKAHIVFIPMPVLDDADHMALAQQMQDRLDKIAESHAVPEVKS